MAYKVEVTLHGMEKIDRNLALIAAAINSRAAKDVYVKAGHVVRRYAQWYAPYDPERKKGTHLKDAILVSRGPEAFPDVIVTVRYKRPGAPHAHLIEFGTVKMSAKPFMRPAASAAAHEVGEIIHAGLKELIESAPK